jgi:hypothetical protein
MKCQIAITEHPMPREVAAPAAAAHVAAAFGVMFGVWNFVVS